MLVEKPSGVEAESGALSDPDWSGEKWLRKKMKDSGDIGWGW